ncbi:hypothetical protein CDL12_00973 [Handroanthus impetiginosus]|uniref:Uncharacterized protein n=1 Tax=Handroanthus impetiginosus TaxID=429701 RepID=A0A2G9I939_9LAMI|nr:hypothetical protein CDL12_00973 [Handroanthus impetiginosus]
MRKGTLNQPRRTNPLIWGAAIICAILAVVVIFTGIVVFIGYLTIRPKVPQISVSRAELDTIYFDQTSLLTVQVTIVIKAENDNAKARAKFSDTNFALSLRGEKIAILQAPEYEVPANSSVEFNYVTQSTPIPLNPEEADGVSASLRQGRVSFELKGTTRTRWRVGFVGSVKFWLHLTCIMELPIDGTAVYPHNCSSRSK